VKEGMITSSPGWIFSSRADISRASVQEVVKREDRNPHLSLKKAWHFLVYIPFPEICP